MKIITEICNRELKSIFYSPVGWVTIIVFMLHSGFLLVGPINGFVSYFHSTGIDSYYYSESFFASPLSIFPTLAFFMYLYVPLLTMGLLSRELHDGSIKLLFSSPITIRQIITGKYMAMIVYGLILVLILSILGFLLSVFVLDKIDTLLFICGILNIYLIFLMYCAIGMFISSMTSYQLVSAVGTFTVIFVLDNYIANFIKPGHPELIQQIFSGWLPPNVHRSSLFGLVNSADVLYYLIMAITFITLTWLRLFFLKNKIARYKTALVYILVIVTSLSSGVYFSHPERIYYVDFTSSRKYSPSEEQIYWSYQIQTPVKLINYVNIIENPYAGTISSIRRGYSGRVQFDYSARVGIREKVNLDFIPYFAYSERVSPAMSRDRSNFSDARQIVRRSITSPSGQNESVDLEELALDIVDKFSWLKWDSVLTPDDFEQINQKYNLNSSAYLAEIDNELYRLPRGFQFPTDQEFTALIKNHFDGPSTIYFLNCAGERDPYGTGDPDFHRVFTRHESQYAVINQGFKVQTITDCSSDSITYIETTNNILVIADPKYSYSDEINDQIVSLIRDGMNMMLLTNREGDLLGSDAIQSELGLSVGSELSDNKYSQIEPTSIIYDENESGFLVNRIMKHRRENAELINSDYSGVDIATPKSNGLLVTSDVTGFEYLPVLSTSNDTVMYALRRDLNGVEQRIIVSGSVDFLSNSTEGVGFRSAFGTNVSNVALSMSLLRWLSNDEYPVLVYQEPYLERLIAVENDFYKILLVWLPPIPILFFGTLILLRRKKE